MTHPRTTVEAVDRDGRKWQVIFGQYRPYYRIDLNADTIKVTVGAGAFQSTCCVLKNASRTAYPEIAYRLECLQSVEDDEVRIEASYGCLKAYFHFITTGAYFPQTRVSASENWDAQLRSVAHDWVIGDKFNDSWYKNRAMKELKGIFKGLPFARYADFAAMAKLVLYAYKNIELGSALREFLVEVYATAIYHDPALFLGCTPAVHDLGSIEGVLSDVLAAANCIQVDGSSLLDKWDGAFMEVE